MARYEDAVRFNFSCPYTGKHCDIWNCESCSVNEAEEEWVKEMQEEESTDAKWQKRIEAIKDEINRYWLDCDLAVDDAECKQCGQNVFGSILRIIDKHTKEGGEQNDSGI